LVKELDLRDDDEQEDAGERLMKVDNHTHVGDDDEQSESTIIPMLGMTTNKKTRASV
jgi:hypothetical protein